MLVFKAKTHIIVRGKERNGDEMHQYDEILQGTNIKAGKEQ